MSDSTLAESPWTPSVPVSEHGKGLTLVSVCAAPWDRIRKVQTGENGAVRCPLRANLLLSGGFAFLKIDLSVYCRWAGVLQTRRQRCLPCKAGQAFMDWSVNSTKHKVSGSSGWNHFYIIHGDKATLKSDLYLCLQNKTKQEGFLFVWSRIYYLFVHLFIYYLFLYRGTIHMLWIQTTGQDTDCWVKYNMFTL